VSQLRFTLNTYEHAHLKTFFIYGVRRLWTAATNGHTVHPPDDMSLRATVEWYRQWKTEELGEKPAPVPLCPPQIPHGLNRARTRASAVRGRRLTAWAMARSFRNLTLTTCEETTRCVVSYERVQKIGVFWQTSSSRSKVANGFLSTQPFLSNPIRLDAWVNRFRVSCLGSRVSSDPDGQTGSFKHSFSVKTQKHL
jgi:hypothetical protein